MRLPFGLIVILLVACSISFVACIKIPKKLRRYKICNGTSCKSIRSLNTSTLLQDNDTFLYNRWSRWTKCNRNCHTSRQRSCKFPLICGNTVIHEEAFCYHRGTYCQKLFQTSKRDYLASSDDALDPSDHSADYEFLSNERSLRTPLIENDAAWRNPASGTNVRPSNHEPRTTRTPFKELPQRDDWSFSHLRNNDTRYTPSRSYNVFSNALDAKPITSSPAYENDYDHLGPMPVCGVAKLTHRNRNGIAMRILGGQEAKQGRWPWQVAILNKMNEAFCGGTLISSKWILTAAHCIRKRLKVTIGEHHLHQLDGTERQYQVEAAFIHPNFDQETVDNDIALLLLPDPVPIEAGLACLPQEHQTLPNPGTLCTILGWGKERHTHVFGTTVLHEGQVPLVSTDDCKFTYGAQEITKNMFCAGYRGGTVDSCAGDSGGPILCSVNNRWIAFGVTSFGDGCGRKGKYGIYAKVANYVNWISKIMKANGGY